MPDADRVPGTAAFTKFILVLQLVADMPRRLTLAELCRRTGLPRPTVYRIVAGLRAEGLIDDDPGGRGFVLGARLISLASKSWEGSDLRGLAHPGLANLRALTGETVHLAVPSGTEMVYIDKLESPQAVRMTSRIGARVLLHATSVGKAYLAALPPGECAALLDRIAFPRITANTIADRDALKAALHEVRTRGYAEDMEETELEIRCLGAAIRNRAGAPIAAISVSIPKHRFTRQAEATYPGFVVACAAEISARIALAGGPLPE